MNICFFIVNIYFITSFLYSIFILLNNFYIKYLCVQYIVVSKIIYICIVCYGLDSMILLTDRSY